MPSGFADSPPPRERSDQQHLDALEEQPESESTWESQREHERNRRAYPGRDVLRSPGSAVVWWMARHEDQIERAVEMIAPLTCLSAAANDREIPKEFRHLFTTSEEPVMSEDPVRDPSTGGFDHPEPVGDEAAPEEGAFETTRPQQATFGDLVSAILDEVGLEPNGAEWTAFLLRLASMCEKAGGKDAADRIRQDLLRTDGDTRARYGTLGDTEGDSSHAGAAEGASATGAPTAGPVPRARAEDAPTAHTNGYDGAGPEETERAERVESGWWDGPQARTAPGVEPFAPPAPDPQPPTYTGPDTAHRNSLDEEERCARRRPAYGGRDGGCVLRDAVGSARSDADRRYGGAFERRGVLMDAAVDAVWRTGRCDPRAIPVEEWEKVSGDPCDPFLNHADHAGCGGDGDLVRVGAMSQALLQRAHASAWGPWRTAWASCHTFARYDVRAGRGPAPGRTAGRYGPGSRSCSKCRMHRTLPLSGRPGMTRRRDESVPFSEVFGLPAHVDLRTAAKALGLSRTTAYRRARTGAFPCRLRKEGRVYVVRLTDLMRGLGIHDVRVRHDDIEAGARFAAGRGEM